jgi:hypothetical protein
MTTLLDELTLQPSAMRGSATVPPCRLSSVTWTTICWRCGVGVSVSPSAYVAGGAHHVL